MPELEALSKTDNRDPRIPLYLAMAHFWLGHQGQAKRLIERAVEIGPSDPDVFYCRSQILRKESLPQAIADLERYVEMTNRPWALNPDKKDARVKAELDYMKRGLLPPDWDRPGKERVPFDPANQKGTPVSEAVRLGSASTATSQVKPTDADPHPAQRAQEGDAASGQTAHQTDDHGQDRHDQDSQQRLPILILVALGAALAVRLWSRGKP